MAKPKLKPRNKRPNPAFGKTSELTGLLSSVGNMAVEQALNGATLEEKMVISALIPTFLKIIRATPGWSAGLLDKLFPEGVSSIELPGLGTLQMTANGDHAEAEPPAGGK